MRQCWCKKKIHLPGQYKKHIKMFEKIYSSNLKKFNYQEVARIDSL